VAAELCVGHINWQLNYVLGISTGNWIKCWTYQLAAELCVGHINWQLNYVLDISTGSWIICWTYQLATELSVGHINWQLNNVLDISTGSWIMFWTYQLTAELCVGHINWQLNYVLDIWLFVSKNNQHDDTCRLSFIFRGSRHSFSTCFELSGSSSSGVQRTRGLQQKITHYTRGWLYREKWTADDELPESSKHVENEWRLPLKIKDSLQVSSCWLFFETIIMMHGTMNVKEIWLFVFSKLCEGGTLVLKHALGSMWYEIWFVTCCIAL